MPDIRYWRASDAEEIADQLLARCGEFRGLELRKIWYVHRSGDMPGEGCKILANTRKLPGLQSALVAGLSPSSEGIMSTPVPQYVVQIAAGPWDVMAEHDRHALIHHELSHIDPIGGGLVAHTAEDFATTTRRFGAWSYGLQAIIANATAYRKDQLAPEGMTMEVRGDGPIADAMREAIGDPREAREVERQQRDMEADNG